MSSSSSSEKKVKRKLSKSHLPKQKKSPSKKHKKKKKISDSSGSISTPLTYGRSRKRSITDIPLVPIEAPIALKRRSSLDDKPKRKRSIFDIKIQTPPKAPKPTNDQSPKDVTTTPTKNQPPSPSETSPLTTVVTPTKSPALTIQLLSVKENLLKIDNLLLKKSRDFKRISGKSLAVIKDSSSPRPIAFTKSETSFFDNEDIKLDVDDDLLPDLDILKELGYPNLTKYLSPNIKKQLLKIPKFEDRLKYYNKVIKKIELWKDKANDHREGSFSLSQSFLTIESQEEEEELSASQQKEEKREQVQDYSNLEEQDSLPYGEDFNEFFPVNNENQNTQEIQLPNTLLDNSLQESHELIQTPEIQ